MAGRFDRCVEVYLKALYEHPTSSFVTGFAREAIRVGRLAGREGEILAGLRHVSAIPLDFQGKDILNTALIEATTGRELAQVATGPRAGLQPGGGGL